MNMKKEYKIHMDVINTTGYWLPLEKEQGEQLSGRVHRASPIAVTYYFFKKI